MTQAITVTRPQDHVALVTIDNPPSNALGAGARAAFLAALDDFDRDMTLRAVVVTGTGKAFCAGDDLREAQVRASGGGPPLATFGTLLDRIEGFRVPVIAAVNGYAIGGGLELALSCDIRLAAEGATFQGAGVNVGLMASVYRLPRLIGVARAKAMLLTGLPADAATALTYGLVTGVFPSATLLDEALALAARIASRAPLSVEATKRQIGRAYDLSPAEAQRAAGEEFATLVKSSDHAAAVAAFLDRRTPEFTRS